MAWVKSSEFRNLGRRQILQLCWFPALALPAVLCSEQWKSLNQEDDDRALLFNRLISYANSHFLSSEHRAQ